MIIISFDSTHHAIHCEMVLDDAGIDSDTLPTPKEIAAGCALSIAIMEEDITTVRSIFLQQCVQTFGFFRKTEYGYVHIGS